MYVAKDIVTQDPYSISADEIVNEVLGDIYDESGVNKDKMYRWLFRIWSALNFDFIRTKQEVILPVYQGQNIVMLPPTYLDLVFFGYVDDCNNLIPIHMNRNLAPDLTQVQDKTKLCPNCGQVDLCKQITQSEITEDIPAAKIIDFKEQDFVVDLNGQKIFPGDTFVKTITREIYPDGSYVENVFEPYSKTNGQGDFVEVDYLQSRNVLCTLDKPCPNCVMATEGNLSMLRSCCCTDAVMCCPTSGLQYPTLSGVASYNLFEQDRYIKLSPDNCLKKVYLKFVSTGVCKNGKYIFPLVAMDTLIDGTYYLSIQKKKNVPQVEKERARRQYTADQKILLRRLTRLSYQEWCNLYDFIPRLPAL